MDKNTNKQLNKDENFQQTEFVELLNFSCHNVELKKL